MLGGGHMTPEERIEAIAQSAELLAGMQLKTEQNLQDLAAAHIETEKSLKRLEDTVNNGFMKTANILRSHDERLDNLEGKQAQ
jgi:hypothetical protein